MPTERSEITEATIMARAMLGQMKRGKIRISEETATVFANARQDRTFGAVRAFGSAIGSLGSAFDFDEFRESRPQRRVPSARYPAAAPVAVPTPSAPIKPPVSAAPRTVLSRKRKFTL